MLSNLKSVLQDECQIDPEKPVLIAISGGADSLCVAEFMIREGYQVIPAHFNHKLRKDSDSDAEFVRTYTETRGLSCIVGEGDVEKIVEQEHQSIEEAARNARYDFLFKIAGEVGAQAVLVGHTANDQVETVLMHLLRGSGLGGLGGMSYRWLPNAWHAEIPLVRPLLGIWREEILAYCRAMNLNPVEDSTNKDRSYFRNRLRLELVPYLETYNPAISKLIWQTSQVLRGDRELIDEIVDAAWLDCVQEAEDGYLAVNSQQVKQYSLGMQRHLIRKAIAHFRPGLRDISFEAVEKGVNQIHSEQSYAEIDLISGLKIVAEPGTLWVAEWEAELPAGDWPQVVQDGIALDIGAEVDLGSGWRLFASQVARNDFLSSQEVNNDPNQVWLDLARIQRPLLVRCRMDGDRFKPSGMEGHSQKISDFMINSKIPRRARDRWPLVCSGDEIVWVAGCRSAHSFGITDNTKEALILTLKRDDGSK